MKFQLILWTIICALVSLVKAQTPEQRLSFLRSVPPSPEAAQITRFGLYPVTQYSGLANISIPLMTVNDGDFKLPLALNYYSGGIKVDEVASTVGLGWSIEAGGVITRTVIGMPDDHAQFGVLDMGVREENSITTQDYGFLRKVLKREVDSDPDLFSYSFNGNSGKFAVFPGGKVVTIPFNNKIHVKYKRSPVNGQLDEFSINDESGNIYVFNTTEVSTTYTDATGPTVWPVTSWYLTDILCNNQADTIHFSYLRAAVKTASYSFSAMGNQPMNMTKNYNDYTNRYVSEIKFRNGSVKFEYLSGRLDYGGYKLNSVSMLNAGNVVVKKVFLEQDYMYSDYGYNIYALPQDKYRLRLLNVYELDAQGNRLGYNLTYNTQRLPPRTNFGTDFWGYYNGSHSNRTFMSINEECPYYIGNNNYQAVAGVLIQIPSVDVANRNVNTDSAKAGMLKKITFPTGGSTEFEFEPNQYEVTTDLTENINHFAGAETNDGTNPPGEIVTFTADQSRTVTMSISLPLYNDINQPRIKLDNLTTGLNVLNLTTFPGEQTSRSVQVNLIGGNQYRITASVLDDPAKPSQEMRLLGTVSWQKITRTIIPKPGGGMRIKSIKSFDASGAVKQQELYKYGPNENGTGSMSYSPFMLTQRYLDNKYTTISLQTCFTLPEVINLMILDNPWYNYSDVGGNKIFYTDVAKYENSYGSNFLKTTYAYDVSGDEKMELPYKDQRIFVNFNWNGGNLLRQCEYKLDQQQQYTLQKKTEYLYNKIEVEQRKGLKVGEKLIADGDLPQSEVTDCYMGKLFYWYNYPVVSGISVPSSKTDSIFESNGTLATETIYTYGNLLHVKPTVISTIDSKGGKSEANFKYVYDYTGITGNDVLSTGVRNFMNKNMNVTLEQSDYFYKGTVKTLKQTLLEAPDGNTTGIKYNAFLKGTTLTSAFNPLINQAGSLVADSRYEKRIFVDLYDTYGNALQYTENGGPVNSGIWDYKSEYQVAQVTNASHVNVAYTSYEADGTGSWKGIVAANIINGGITGKKCYTFGTEKLQKEGLTTSEKYIVSFWARQGANIVVSNSLANRTGRTKGDWTYYEHEVSGAATISVSGSGSIDELRLYPLAAQMITRTFEPLIGISSVCDARGNIQYFEYDSLGRLQLIRDLNGMILKNYQYSYNVSVP